MYSFKETYVGLAVSLCHYLTVKVVVHLKGGEGSRSAVFVANITKCIRSKSFLYIADWRKLIHILASKNIAAKLEI